MPTDKPSNRALEPATPPATAWFDSEEEIEPSAALQHLRVMIERAALVYFALLFGLGAMMSLLGLNPLAHNGLMPKALLLFVGSALLLALANTLTELSYDYDRSWVSLMGRWRRSDKK